MQIKVTHIGQDYAEVKVNTVTYQVPYSMGVHIRKIQRREKECQHIFKVSKTSRTKKCMKCGVAKKDQ